MALRLGTGKFDALREVEASHIVSEDPWIQLAPSNIMALQWISQPCIWLVVWNHGFYDFPIDCGNGMSSSQLTNPIIFQRDRYTTSQTGWFHSHHQKICFFHVSSSLSRGTYISYIPIIAGWFYSIHIHSSILIPCNFTLGTSPSPVEATHPLRHVFFPPRWRLQPIAKLVYLAKLSWLYGRVLTDLLYGFIFKQT